MCAKKDSVATPRQSAWGLRQCSQPQSGSEDCHFLSEGCWQGPMMPKHSGIWGQFPSRGVGPHHAAVCTIPVNALSMPSTPLVFRSTAVSNSLQRVSHQVSVWEHCRIGMPASSKEDIGEVCLTILCQWAVSGLQMYYFSCTRGQSCEADTPFRPFGSSSVNCGTMLQNPISNPSFLFQWRAPIRLWCWNTLLVKEAIEIIPLPERELVLPSSEEGW